MKLIAGFILGALIGACMMWGWGLKEIERSIIFKTDTVTVFYPAPTQIARTTTPKTIRIPMMMFAPVDTVKITVPNGDRADSVEIAIEMETVVYQDSTYKAQVSGPKIGDLGPKLDWMDTKYVQGYSTLNLGHKNANRWGIGLQAGYGFQAGPQIRAYPYIGVGISYNIIRW